MKRIWERRIWERTISEIFRKTLFYGKGSRRLCFHASTLSESLRETRTLSQTLSETLSESLSETEDMGADNLRDIFTDVTDVYLHFEHPSTKMH